MLLEEFDEKKYVRTIREDGLKEGQEEGRSLVNRLGLLLTETGRSGKFLESLFDQELQKKLLAEFELEEDGQ